VIAKKPAKYGRRPQSISRKRSVSGCLIASGFKELSTSLDAAPGSLLWSMKISKGLLPNDKPELFKQMQHAAGFFWGKE
jgi:hypothetical protein